MASEGHSNDWEIHSLSAEGVQDHVQQWTQQQFIPVSSSLFSNLSGTLNAESEQNKDSALAFLQHTSLGLGNLFLPDINSTTPTVLFHPQGGGSPKLSPQFAQLGEIPQDFVFQAPPNRGRPKGSKTKKPTARIWAIRFKKRVWDNKMEIKKRSIHDLY